MEKLTLFLVLLIVSCNHSNSNPDDKVNLFNTPYSDFKNISFLKDYEKISDTSFSKAGYDPTHRITELQKNDKKLILFSKIELDSNRREIYSVLDTLQINRLTQDQVLTIGYCEVENSLMEEIIAIFYRTDPRQRKIYRIHKAWKANAESNKIEPIRNSEVKFCWDVD